MKSHLIKIGLLVIFIILFYWIGGFEPPNFDHFKSYRRTRGRIQILWCCSIMLYFIGAFALLWGDKKVGDIDPTSFRFIYITCGLIAMAAGFIISKTINELGY